MRFYCNRIECLQRRFGLCTKIVVSSHNGIYMSTTNKVILGEGVLYDHVPPSITVIDASACGQIITYICIHTHTHTHLHICSYLDGLKFSAHAHLTLPYKSKLHMRCSLCHASSSILHGQYSRAWLRKEWWIVRKKIPGRSWRCLSQRSQARARVCLC